MVYVDNFYVTGGGNYGRMKMSHMIADTHEELIRMVRSIGVSPKWIQNEGTDREHFDVCMVKRQRAIQLGAKDVPFRDLVAIRKNIDWDNYDPKKKVVRTGITQLNG